jgi:aminoglycoside phosphotransferase (APT) family kinase protein
VFIFEVAAMSRSIRPMMPTESKSLMDALPADLRASSTISRIAAGLSGAGVYRIESDGRAFVLKVSRDDEPSEHWRGRVDVLRRVSEAGLAPRVVHVDESRRAVLSELVVDAGVAMLIGNPATRADAVSLLGRTLRRVHDVPVPASAPASEPLALLARLRASIAAFPVPAFALETIDALSNELPPPLERELVLSHNDVNPTNLVYDGTKLLLLDWDTAGPNDPLYDLAAVSVFFRMDEPTCIALVGAHDGAPVARLSPRFRYLQRLVAGLCGAAFLHLARHGGFEGDRSLSREAADSLADFYQRLRVGEVNVGSAAGQWAFGLALLRHSGDLPRAV